jgi:hypothetical protein
MLVLTPTTSTTIYVSDAARLTNAGIVMVASVHNDEDGPYEWKAYMHAGEVERASDVETALLLGVPVSYVEAIQWFPALAGMSYR